MAKNSTIPQPSAAPPMSPDASASTMRRFTPPASAAAGSITLLEDTTACVLQRGILDGLLQRLYPPLDVCPLRDRVAQLAGARATGRRELFDAPARELATSPWSLSMRCCMPVNKSVRLQ